MMISAFRLCMFLLRISAMIGYLILCCDTQTERKQWENCRESSIEMVSYGLASRFQFRTEEWLFLDRYSILRHITGYTVWNIRIVSNANIPFTGITAANVGVGPRGIRFSGIGFISLGSPPQLVTVRLDCRKYIYILFDHPIAIG